MKRIAEERKKQNLSQQELGELLGVSQQTISKYEKGTREPDTQTLIKLSRLFGVSVDYLLSNCNSDNETDIIINNKIKQIFSGTNMINENGTLTESGIAALSEFVKNNKNMIQARANSLDIENQK